VGGGVLFNEANARMNWREKAEAADGKILDGRAVCAP